MVGATALSPRHALTFVTAPHAPQPHPSAPPEVRENFQSFLSKLQSSSGGSASPSSNPKGQSLESSGRGEVKPSSGPSGGVKSGEGTSEGAGATSGGSTGAVDYEHFWEAPRSLWETKPFSEAEIEAVMVSPPSESREAETLMRCSPAQSGGASNITSGP